jgi:hypothetical protein
VTSLVENAPEGTRLIFPDDMDKVEDMDKVRNDHGGGHGQDENFDKVRNLDKVITWQRWTWTKWKMARLRTMTRPSRDKVEDG